MTFADLEPNERAALLQMVAADSAAVTELLEYAGRMRLQLEIVDLSPYDDFVEVVLEVPRAEGEQLRKGQTLIVEVEP